MTTSNTYLYFSGTCEEALGFYAKVLGAEVDALMKTGDTPRAAHAPPELADKVMHARLKIGDVVVMASDVPPDWYRTPQGFHINVTVDDVAEAERIYAALAEGGTQTMAIAETFWAKRFGTCTDRFGTPWMINCDKPRMDAA